jgi:transcriptional regulator with XRE-family HTH domain
MSKADRYASVTEMVHAVSEGREFRNSFDKRIAERQIIKLLISLRALGDKSQKDIAAAMKCSQSRISKLENGKDNDMRLEDLHGYLIAAGYDLKIVIGKQGQNAFDEVKYHAFSIKRLLDDMARLAGQDQTIGRGVLKLEVRP